jgi:hypothetical protein
VSMAEDWILVYVGFTTETEKKDRLPTGIYIYLLYSALKSYSIFMYCCVVLRKYFSSERIKSQNINR